MVSLWRDTSDTGNDEVQGS